jgi:hypothetical protein
VSYVSESKIALRGCPYLGRCEDRETFYSFPSFENCCHTEAEPAPIEPSYQADTCLAKSWPACLRYKALQEGIEAPPAAAAGWQQWIHGLGVPVGVFAGIVAVIGLALVVLLFILLSKDPAPATPTPTTAMAGLASGVTETAIAAQSAMPTAALTAAPTASPSQVPSATATWTPTDLPAPTDSPTPTDTPTPTRTPVPTRTLRPTATATRSPTHTATATHTATPRPTTRLPSPTPKAAATPTQLPAPVLLSPANGQEFTANAQITLEWQSLGSLPADVYYVVAVVYTSNGVLQNDDKVWIRKASWLLNEHQYLIDLSDDGRFQWSVQVMQQTGTDANSKPTGTALSQKSEVRTLIWRRASGPGPGPTVPPP